MASEKITQLRIGPVMVGLVAPFLLILLLSTLLIAGEIKAPSPALPDTRKEFDQNEPKAISSDHPFSSPMAPSNEKTGFPNPLIPPPLNIQEETGTGG